MTWFITILARWGVSQRLAKPLAYIGGAVLVLALLGALWAILSARENADDRANQQIGATVEREKAAEAVIQNVEKANEARIENSNRTDDQRHADCVRRSRTPENC